MEKTRKAQKGDNVKKKEPLEECMSSFLPPMEDSFLVANAAETFQEDFENILSARKAWAIEKLETLIRNRDYYNELKDPVFYSYEPVMPKDGIVYRIVSKADNGSYVNAIPLTPVLNAEPHRHLRHVAISAESTDVQLGSDGKPYSSYKSLNRGDCISVKNLCEWETSTPWDGDEMADFRKVFPPLIVTHYALLRFQKCMRTNVDAIAFKHGRNMLKIIVGKYHPLAAPYCRIPLPRTANHLPYLWETAPDCAKAIIQMEEGRFCVIKVDIYKPLPGVQRYPAMFRNNMADASDRRFMDIHMASVSKTVDFDEFAPSIVKIRNVFITDDEFFKRLRLPYEVQYCLEAIELINCSLAISRFQSEKQYKGYNTNMMSGIPRNIVENKDNREVTFDIELNFDGESFPTAVRLLIIVGNNHRLMPADILAHRKQNGKIFVNLAVRFSNYSLQRLQYQEDKNAKNVDYDEFVQFLRDNNTAKTVIYCRQESVGDFPQARYMMKRAWEYLDGHRIEPKCRIPTLIKSCFPKVGHESVELVVEPGELHNIKSFGKLLEIEPTIDQWRTIYAAKNSSNLIVIDTPAGGGKTTCIAQCAVILAVTEPETTVAIISSANATTEKIVETIERVEKSDGASKLRILRFTTNDGAQRSQVSTRYDSTKIFEEVITKVVRDAKSGKFPANTHETAMMLFRAFGYANEIMKLNAGQVPDSYGTAKVGFFLNGGKRLPIGEKPDDVFNMVGMHFYKPNVVVATSSMMFSIPHPTYVKTVLLDDVSAESPWSIFQMLLPFDRMRNALLFGDSAQIVPLSGEKSFQRVLPNGCEFLKNGNLQITHKVL